MHLKQTRRNGRIYLSVVQNYREGGATKTKTVESIGYADAFADRYPDPVEHFKAYVRELNERRRAENPPISLTFPRDAEIDAGHVASARWGSAIALAYLDALGVRGFFEARAGHTGFPPHAGRIFEMLASERVIHVASKRESWQRRASFPRACDFTLAEMYEALSCFVRNDRALATAMARSYERMRGPYRTESVTLVLAPFSLPDAGDVRAADGPTAPAREAPSAGIGVFIDRNSMPMGYRITSATPTPEEVAALVADAKATLGARRVIAVAGRTPHADSILSALAATGDGFVFYRPIRETLPEMQSWVTDDAGYTTTQSGSYKVKSRLGDAAGIPVRELVLWGRDYAAMARKERGAEGGGEGELDGYICIASNETRLPAGVLFHLYRELWRLIEPFQVMESDFSPSPYPVDHATHLRAHFLICYAAFFAMRLLRSDMGWTSNAAQVADALQRMEGTYLAENWFVFSYRSDVSDAIERAAGVDAARRLRTAADIRRGINQAREHIETPR